MWLGSIRPRSQCVGGMFLVHKWCYKHVLNKLSHISSASCSADSHVGAALPLQNRSGPFRKGGLTINDHYQAIQKGNAILRRAISELRQPTAEESLESSNRKNSGRAPPAEWCRNLVHKSNYTRAPAREHQLESQLPPPAADSRSGCSARSPLSAHVTTVK